MRVTPYLNFNGQCEAAFKFYEQCFGGKILMMMTCGDSPIAEQMPPGWRDKILHVTLEIGDQVLQGADAPPEHYRQPQGFSVSMNIEDISEAERIFKALAEGGTVQMPLQETFWAQRFGMTVDRFGTPWMVNCGRGG